MSESIVAINEGTGKKLHTNQRTIGANEVQDEYVLLGENALSSYAVTTGSSVILTTAASHLTQIMAGATLNVRIRRILVYQAVLATTAAIAQFEIRRLTTAGTGGTVLTSTVLETTDAGAGATAMSLPTVKGTEGARLWLGAYTIMQTAPTAGSSNLMFDLNFDDLRLKPLMIPAGTANGIAFKNISGHAVGQVFITVLYTETNF